MTVELEWEECTVDSDYEICTAYPHQIRKKETGKIVSEWNHPKGYLCVDLNKQHYLKHRVIALQFIPNPNKLEQIDHINHIKTDNRIENLRWCSNQQNSNQRSCQRFTDKIPDEAIHVTTYNDYNFDELYFHDDVFYVYNGINYVIKPRYQSHSGYWYINMTDTEGRPRKISYNKFKRIYDLL